MKLKKGQEHVRSLRLAGRASRIGSLLFILLSVLALATTRASAQTLNTLYSFTGGSDGIAPNYGSLIADASGNLYGATLIGGGPTDGGTVFKLTPSGTETVLHSFTFQFPSALDGWYPQAGVIADASGNLYGTTFYGGPYSSGYGYGVVFKVTPSGTETILYPFTGGSDGGNPSGGLIADAAGNLYGTTQDGGAYNSGTVFKLTPSGTETVLYSFTGYNDGAAPFAGLIADASGNLYGTTLLGGAYGPGTVFKVTPSGTETVLHSFTGGGDGGLPYAGLIADAAGNLYGTTAYGGAYGWGSVFKVTPSGTETVLYSFTDFSDGGIPYAGLIVDASGNLYGTASTGGNTSGACAYFSFGACGVVFKVAPSGTETVLYSFTGGNDGANPWAGLIADASGNLYGTTSTGGASGYDGTVFKLSGTGFVPLLAFSAFSAKLDISSAGFDLNGNFTLGQGGTIQPLTQPLSLQVGTYSVTVPAGSFKAGPKGTFTYQGTIGGVALQIRISPNGANAYQIQVDASGVNLTGLTNPVKVSLTIGNNNGTTSVTADF